jgi:hypothetical protein
MAGMTKKATTKLKIIATSNPQFLLQVVLKRCLILLQRDFLRLLLRTLMIGEFIQSLSYWVIELLGRRVLLQISPLALDPKSVKPTNRSPRKVSKNSFNSLSVSFLMSSMRRESNFNPTGGLLKPNLSTYCWIVS